MALNIWEENKVCVYIHEEGERETSSNHHSAVHTSFVLLVRLVTGSIELLIYTNIDLVDIRILDEWICVYLSWEYSFLFL